VDRCGVVVFDLCFVFFVVVLWCCDEFCCSVEVFDQFVVVVGSLECLLFQFGVGGFEE